MAKKLTQVEFLIRAVKAHGAGTYDYSQVICSGSKDIISIICLKHGLFKQLAALHMNGTGCQKCSVLALASAKTWTLDDFIIKAQQVHGVDTYDYSQVVYVRSIDKVRIICPEHGAFEQKANGHIRGKGCKGCAKEKGSITRTLTTQRFIAKAGAVHGFGTYDYSEVSYTRSSNKVNIICPSHGAFEQTANSHLNGAGCRKCGGEAWAERRKAGWIACASNKICTLYFLRMYDEKEDFYKIGITYTSIKSRYKSVKLRGGYDYEIIAEHKSESPSAIYEWEQSILETFSHLRYRPKRSFSGETECFLSADEILTIFPL
jgi:hypothetical protein